MQYRVLWSICVCLAGFPAAAQELSKDEIVAQLRPRQPVTRGLIRTIRVEPSDPDSAIREKANLPSVSMRVQFEFDSAVLTPEGQASLRTLGEALSDAQLRTSTFLIGGHTDSRGSEAYNQALSWRRARSVRDFLIARYRLPAGRLRAIGFGKRELADPKDPEGGINRRVEIVNLTH
jgi:outer membrane protein OmpA-like peptidoglycan-associated protein